MKVTGCPDQERRPAVVRHAHLAIWEPVGARTAKSTCKAVLSRGRAAAEPPRDAEIAADMTIHKLQCSGTGVGLLAGEHLVEDHAEAVQVAA